MAIKISLKKLELKKSLSEIPLILENNGFNILPITIEDTLLVSVLPFYHRDPFDRIIIAQTQNNNLLLISKDEEFKRYNINPIW